MMPDHKRPAPDVRRLLPAILLLAVLLRVGVALYLGDSVPPGKDETSYFTLGVRVAGGHGFSFDRPWYPFAPADAPTAHWSFLYTAFVAAVVTVAGPHPLAVRLVSAIASGLLLPWLTYRLARRVSGGRGQGSGAGDRGEASEDIADRTSYNVHRTSNIEHSTFAAFLSAIYPYFILYGAMVQTEAFYICALLWSLERALALESHIAHRPSHIAHRPSHIVHRTSHMVHRTSSITLGLSLGLATLLRQSILPWAVVLFAWLLWRAVRDSVGDRPQRGGWKVAASPLPSQAACVPRSGRGSQGMGANSSNSCNSRQTSIGSLIIAGLVLLACIAPFTIRNYRAYSDFLLLNSNAGYAMYSAQHPMHGVSFQEYAAAPLPADLLAAGLNEAQWDKALMQRGIGFILAEPGRYLLLCLSRVADYFEFWPKPVTSLVNNIGRVASFGLFLPFMLYGLYLTLRHSLIRHSGSTARNTQYAILILFILFYSALHIATWAMPRYRLPVDAVLLIFAAVGIADLVGRATRVRRQGAGRPQVG